MQIIVTQRSDDHGQYAERRDALDRSWYTTLQQLFGPKSVLFPAPNEPRQIDAFIDTIKPEALILTGGNDLSSFAAGQNVEPDRDAVEQALLLLASNHHLPVLAVCRGFQYLNAFCGGSATPVCGHVAQPHTVNLSEGGVMKVNSYHTHAISPKGLAPDLQPLVHDAAGYVEAACHKRLPWLGIMWHPERVQPEAKSAQWLVARLAQYCRV